MQTTIQNPSVTDAHKQQYQDEGYFILERVIPDDMLAMLREECSYFIGYQDATMEAKGQDVDGINHKGKRYFINNQYHKSTRLWQFLYSPLMAEVASAALGPEVYLFHEQWVVKGPEQGMKFAWHQDSGYVKHDDPNTNHKPYLTCWCPLDDVTEENGTVYLLPHSRGGTKDRIVNHTQEKGTNDLVGYTGDDPGILAEVPAGSIVCFSSYNLHRSTANTTANMRRVYLPQYSSEPIHNCTTHEQWALAVPFVKDGQVIYDHEADR